MNGSFIIIIQFLLVSTLAGLISVTAMTLFMNTVTRTGFANADMVRAIGSIFTKSYESAHLVGGILHTASGVAFGIIYTLLLSFLEIEGTAPLILVGGVIGLLHGFVLSFLLVISVAEHHPLPEFRTAGFGVAVSHLLGHVVFGLFVGLVIAATGFRIV